MQRSSVLRHYCLAYNKGVVIAVCKGCKTKHLIADNLGWSNVLDGFDGHTNIEDYMKSKGFENEVKRVSSSVFDLERTLHVKPQSKKDFVDHGEGFE